MNAGTLAIIANGSVSVGPLTVDGPTAAAPPSPPTVNAGAISGKLRAWITAPPSPPATARAG